MVVLTGSMESIDAVDGKINNDVNAFMDGHRERASLGWRLRGAVAHNVPVLQPQRRLKRTAVTSESAHSLSPSPDGSI